MSRTLIQKYYSSVIKDFIERANDLKSLKHELTKGEIKELFVSRVLKSLLTSQFSIGSGVIINQEDNRSNQTDIVIYDNRILPPFIKEQNIGVYPAEGVIATVEIATTLNGGKLESAEKAAQKLHRDIFKLKYNFKPLCAVFGFSGGVKNLSKQKKGMIWLKDNIECLFNICIAERYCWANVGKKDWRPEFQNENKPHNATKRFLSLLVDNIRTESQRRFQAYINAQTHQDWLTAYIRD